MTIMRIMGKDCEPCLLSASSFTIPPQDGYPFLAVALSPTRDVSAVAYDTRQEAEAHNAALATEVARAKPGGDQDA
jgi:hypothetical protein